MIIVKSYLRAIEGQKWVSTWNYQVLGVTWSCGGSLCEGISYLTDYTFYDALM